jgi:hypothetical protein
VKADWAGCFSTNARKSPASEWQRQTPCPTPKWSRRRRTAGNNHGGKRCAQGIEGVLSTVPYLKKLGVSADQLIYKFDFNGARFIYLWTGKYDYRSPKGWDATRPSYEEQIKQLKQWIDGVKASGTRKVFITLLGGGGAEQDPILPGGRASRFQRITRRISIGRDNLQRRNTTTSLWTSNPGRRRNLRSIASGHGRLNRSRRWNCSALPTERGPFFESTKKEVRKETDHDERRPRNQMAEEVPSH